MAPPSPLVVVTDAGPLIHLDQFDCLDLLRDFSAVHTTQVVWREALRHRPDLTAAVIPVLRVEETVRPVTAAGVRQRLRHQRNH